jgi:hypothetical protein
MLAVKRDPVVAIGLLTQTNLTMFGSTLKKVFPINETPCFTELLRAIDEADREWWRDRDHSERIGPSEI